MGSSGWIKVGIAAVIVALIAVFVITGIEDEGEPIKIVYDTGTESIMINAEIGAFIIEHGYGYPAEFYDVAAHTWLPALETGELDINFELWRLNFLEWYNRVTAEGSVIDLGPIYETSTQGWYVPRYVVEGDPERGIEPMAPGLTSVFDLPDHWEVFKDPEDPTKGFFQNSMEGWGCTVINEIKLEVYGLTEYFNHRTVSSAAAMDAALIGKYQRGEPAIFYHWEPTPFVSLLDLIRLEEPEYDEDVWQKIITVMDGDMDVSELEEACAYPDYTIHKGINSGLKDRAPEVVDFLDKMLVGDEAIRASLALMIEEDAEPIESALYFFENYEELWRSWLPDDVEAKVADALRNEGVSLQQ